MFKKNPVLWGGLIFILIVLNLWKWLPAFQPKGRHAGGDGLGRLTLGFPLPPEKGQESFRRDLFSMGAAPELSRGPRNKIKTVKKTGPDPKPQPTSVATPAGPAVGAAGGYRLMGMVSRGGKSMALVGKGDEVFQVAAGDEVGGQYQVKSIGENEVYLTEKQSGNTLKLRIWDQQGAKP